MSPIPSEALGDRPTRSATPERIRRMDTREGVEEFQHPAGQPSKRPASDVGSGVDNDRSKEIAEEAVRASQASGVDSRRSRDIAEQAVHAAKAEENYEELDRERSKKRGTVTSVPSDSDTAAARRIQDEAEAAHRDAQRIVLQERAEAKQQIKALQDQYCSEWQRLHVEAGRRDDQMRAFYTSTEAAFKNQRELAEAKHQELQNECQAQLEACKSASAANSAEKDQIIEQLRVQLEGQASNMTTYHSGASAEITNLKGQLNELYQAAQSAVSQKDAEISHHTRHIMDLNGRLKWMEENAQKINDTMIKSTKSVRHEDSRDRASFR